MQASDKKYSSKKYIAVTAIVTLIMLLCIGMISYIVDPFLQFRARPDTRYFLNPRFVNGGLAKNYDYNTVIIGSSMAQNYNLNILREMDPGAKPVKLSTGGMNCIEMEYLYSFVKKEKAKTIIINLDITQFNALFEEIRYPRYLYDDGVLNKLQYLYGYETFVRFAPIDIGLTFYLKDKENISPQYEMKTTIDNVGNTSLDGHYSAEHVKSLYLSGWTVSEQPLKNMESRMQNRLDTMLMRIAPDKYKDTNFIFVMPPYSALYWHHTKKMGYYDQFTNFTYYLDTAISKYDNARIAFYFDIEEITDLNYYTDITHFSPAISDKILRNINNPDYTLNSSDIDRRLHQVDSLVSVFAEKNKDWLK